jgi:hypothetical protein
MARAFKHGWALFETVLILLLLCFSMILLSFEGIFLGNDTAFLTGDVENKGEKTEV